MREFDQLIKEDTRIEDIADDEDLELEDDEPEIVDEREPGND